ncbi:Hypothetical protein CINCED_3A018215 [Cinara cedri]|uniref:Uncharacterized protein n=1 Tax=Cinara cedri TaxID=506608 RepID=A0A5E4NFT5_9HEMI|nr:Hypothetical protein CINCED_3A018215 [Cinara cedri]
MVDCFHRFIVEVEFGSSVSYTPEVSNSNTEHFMEQNNVELSIVELGETEVSNTEHYMEQSIVDISFKKPDSNNIAMYWLFHPNQPTKKIPFTADKAYKQKDGSYRKRLSYNTKDKALFCYICIAYGRDSGVFI